MPDWLLGVIAGAAIVVGGHIVSAWLQMWSKKVEVKETRRRDVADASLRFLDKYSGLVDNPRRTDQFIEHYKRIYDRLMELYEGKGKGKSS